MLRRTVNLISPKFRFLAKHNFSTDTMSDEKKLVETEKIGNIFMIGINRPEKRNCVNQETAIALTEAVEYFENQEDLFVAVLYGKGGTFCAGYDLKQLSETDTDQSVNLSSADLSNGRGPMGPSRRFIKKPMIAAVEGYAVAGGLELSLMCDLRVVDEKAIMGVFCRRFGVPLLDGGTVRLPLLIGLSRAMDLILTGRPVNAREAMDMGLANYISSPGSALGKAMNVAETLCKFPQECMRRDRLSAYNSLYNKSQADAFDFEWDNAKHVIQQESVGGAKKFVSGLGRGGDFDWTKKANL